MPKKKPSRTDPASRFGQPSADPTEGTAETDQEARRDAAPREPASEPRGPGAPEGTAPEGPSQEAADDRPLVEGAIGERDTRAEATRPAATQPGEAARSDALQVELQQLKDHALRLQAELENYRKRVAREMQEQRRYANLPLIRDLLPVLDNMDRAIQAAEKTLDAAALLKGVKMVAEQFESVLRQHHCVRIEALNEPFDPHRHEAVSQQPSDQHPPGAVLMVTQNGFQLHDRVVRPSQVVVSTANRQKQQEGKPPAE